MYVCVCFMMTLMMFEDERIWMDDLFLQYASSKNKLCNSMTVGTDQKTLQGGPASHMMFLTYPEQMATERSTLFAPISYPILTWH